MHQSLGLRARHIPCICIAASSSVKSFGKARCFLRGVFTSTPAIFAASYVRAVTSISSAYRRPGGFVQCDFCVFLLK